MTDSMRVEPDVFSTPSLFAERFDALVGGIVEGARLQGLVVKDELVRNVLWEAGLGDVLEDLAVAQTVLRAADGFHPIARFFVEGSAERELIVRMLRD